jgi:WD40 repeat protein
MEEKITSNQEPASLLISYSRVDKDFVRNLYETLTITAGIPEENIWIDWDDIPPAADWMDEITRAIGAADAFVFVISPDSLNSKVCAQEIGIAVENNKKLIPIVFRDPQETDPLPEKISSTNWIFMRQDDDPEEALALLLEAVNTDLDWVREHTRILKRALEWDQQGQDKSFLLRGVDLDTAEGWQANAVEGKDPQPTPLQTMYIQSSRQDAKRRRRNLLIGVSIALVVSIVLGITALFQWQDAQDQAEINLVRQLSAQATSKMDERLDLASLLSLEALRLSERRNTVTDISRAEVEGSLLSVITHKPALKGFLHGHSAQIVDVDIHVEAGLIATASLDGTVRLIDAHTLHLLFKFEIEADELFAAAISPDGKQLATGSASGVITLWDAATGLQIAELADAHDSQIIKIAYAPKGNSLISADAGGQVIEFDLATLDIYRIVYNSDSNGSFAFDPSGSTLAIGTQDGYIDLFNMTDGENIQSIDSGVDDAINAVVFTDAGQSLVSGGVGGIVELWDVETGAALDSFEYPGVIAINSLDFDPHSGFLAVGSDNRNVLLVALGENGNEFSAEVHLLSAHVGEIFDIDFSDDGKFLISGGVDQTAILWDTVEGFKGRGSDIETVYSHHESDVNKVAFNHDGTLLASASDDALIYIQDVTGDDVGRRELSDHNGRVLDVVFDPRGEILASSDSEGDIILWQAETGQKIGERLKHGSEVAWLPLAFSPDGKLLASGSVDGSIILWDMATGRQAGDTLLGHESDVMALAFSPDGSTLASGSLDWNIILWDVGTGDQIGILQNPAQVQAVIFTADGQRLISGSWDAQVRIWDLESGDPIIQLPGHLGDVTDLALNSDETLLASGSTDGNVILWDMTSLEQIGYLSGSPASLIGISFSPTQPLIAAASRDDNVYVWETDIAAWKAVACFRANRNLTQAEWNRYIGSQEEYHLTCPDNTPPTDRDEQ